MRAILCAILVLSAVMASGAPPSAEDISRVDASIELPKIDLSKAPEDQPEIPKDAVYLVSSKVTVRKGQSIESPAVIERLIIGRNPDAIVIKRGKAAIEYPIFSADGVVLDESGDIPKMMQAVRAGRTSGTRMEQIILTSQSVVIVSTSYSTSDVTITYGHRETGATVSTR